MIPILLIPILLTQAQAQAQGKVAVKILDEQLVTRAGYARISDPVVVDTPNHGDAKFKRSLDDSLLTVSWTSGTSDEIAAKWKAALSSLQHRPKSMPMPPSAQRIGDDWIFVSGESGQAWILTVRSGNAIVSTTLHYSGYMSEGKVKWKMDDPRADGKLVEDLTRSVIARLVPAR